MAVGSSSLLDATAGRSGSVEGSAAPLEPAPPLLSDTSGVVGLSGSEEARYEAFYRQQLAPTIAFLCVSGVPSRHAPDVAQEAMIEAYRHWQSIRFPNAWIRRVASRIWARRVANSVEDLAFKVPERNVLVRFSDIEKWEQRQELLAWLVDLPPRQRQIMAWTLDGFEPREIARELGMNDSTVRATLRDARNAIAARLRRQTEER
jgi:RNA polymerase sigma factor (sigma-70 family)